MAEAALITTADVNLYRQLDTKIDSTRFAAYVMDIQRTNLRDLLGQALYYALMADSRSTGIYADLLNGKTYTYNSNTVQYYGLKPILCYWFLAIHAREGEVFNSGYGAIELVNNPQQNFEKAKEKERLAQSYTQTAEHYANDLRQFLNQHSTTYTLWESESESNGATFISFKI